MFINGLLAGIELQIRESKRQWTIVQRFHGAPDRECARNAGSLAMFAARGHTSAFPPGNRNAGLPIS
jgi:hypothetical protein